MNNDKIKIFCDFDGVIVNTIKSICTLYSEDFVAYKKFKPVDWSEINSWEFKELEAATREYIDTYFNTPRFFDRLEWMPWAKETLEKLSDNCDITIVSAGYSPNLLLKENWIKDNLPFCKFIGVNFKEHQDKSHIDMSGGIFIDDSFNNLKTSNASINVCFGDDYEWNKEWTGIRCRNWCDLWKMFKFNKEV